jgi:ubiquinone/menaquinone biosynthesis C-methylase UbiE
VIPSPNIWRHPDVYELENHAVDPGGVIETAMRAVRDWRGATVLDIGCGSGFHLPRFAVDAASVVGVEPHPPLIELTRRRTAGLAHVDVRTGTAQRLPVPDASVDIVHARWAYFFGPGCEPGLREVQRVLRRGGAAFVIDNDGTRSTFGSWFRRALPSYDPQAVERFWARQGWSRTPLDIRWACRSRAEFESVVRIEFEPRLAEEILAKHPGSEVDYAVNLFWRTT